jgi:SAM-dependent methyltransferase
VLFKDRARAESFGSVAKLYDRVRPSYPAPLIDALLDFGDGDAEVAPSAPTGTGMRVLDVGCGTGIAGALLAERGCRVLGVEVDHRMAELARAKGLEVEESAFERWDDRGRRFDLVVSGQAWHWIDPQLGPEKAAHVLPQRGGIALFWNLGDPLPEARERLAPVYARLEPELENYSLVLGRQAGRDGQAQDDLMRSDRFDEIAVRRFPWRRTYKAGEWLDFLRTHSDHAVLPPDRLERLLRAVGSEIDRMGGSFEVEYEATMVSGRRR